MAVKRADALVVGDVLADERTVTAISGLSRGDVGVTFDGGTQERYGPAFQFVMEDPVVDWRRIAIRRLWFHPNDTLRAAARIVIQNVRDEAGL